MEKAMCNYTSRKMTSEKPITEAFARQWIKAAESCVKRWKSGCLDNKEVEDRYDEMLRLSHNVHVEGERSEDAARQEHAKSVATDIDTSYRKLKKMWSACIALRDAKTSIGGDDGSAIRQLAYADRYQDKLVTRLLFRRTL